MIKSISLQNFKCYQEETHFDLKQINLLTGINGKGKSTFLQSILLIAQAKLSLLRTQDSTFHGNLNLNDSLVRLGTFDDVRNAHISRNMHIIFKFNYYYNILGSKGGKHIVTYRFGPSNDDRVLEFMGNDKPNSVTWRMFNWGNTHYISADRLGPQEFYEKIDMNDLRVGKKGEFVAQVLANAQKSQMIVDELLALSKNRLLVAQASEWLGHVLGHPNISLEVNGDNRYTISLTFKMGTKSYTMPNVGFGYSYILPIIVSGLIAKPDEILIIENPEAHLHPRAQSRLAHFLAKVAKTGVQVFIESHSDHILNALRVAVKNKNLNTDDLQIFYFAENPDEDTPNIFTPQVDEDGRIDEWPDGFFDEWNNNLMELL
jgi:predicted ATPase